MQVPAPVTSTACKRTVFDKKTGKHGKSGIHVGNAFPRHALAISPGNKAVATTIKKRLYPMGYWTFLPLLSNGNQAAEQDTPCSLIIKLLFLVKMNSAIFL